MILAVLLSGCFAQQVQTLYEAKQVPALRALAAEAATAGDSLVLRYRLYALDRDPRHLRQLPDPTPSSPGRDLALLSALWAWRIPGSAPWNVVRYGRRAGELLDRALAAAPGDPLVRLVEAQSLLFRPGIAGGDVRLAARKLSALRQDLADDACGTGRAEIDYWLWFALRKMNDPSAGTMRSAMERDSTVPVLYREMLAAFDSVNAGR